MTRFKLAALLLAPAVAIALGSTTLYAQEHETVNAPTSVHDQTVKHFQEVLKALAAMGTPETPFDFVHPAVSGPVVVLQGFTVNGALKDNAQAQVQKLEWVTHVVNEVELLDVGPELRRVRQQVLATLQRLVPQAFPERRAQIRIKVTLKGDVTLVGVISPKEKERLAAAVEQVKHVEMVGSVTNNVVETTS